MSTRAKKDPRVNEVDDTLVDEEEHALFIVEFCR